MKVGKVTSIEYNQLRVKISSEIRGNSVNIRGDIYYFGNIGNYLKVDNSVGEVIICEVISIFDSDPHKGGESFNMESDRELRLTPIGTLSKKQNNHNNREFTLGVGIFPSLYSDVSIVTRGDMEQILKVEEEEKDNNKTVHKSLTLGISKNLINYQVKVPINELFNIHTAVLGNSGSGKSNTIAHIIQKVYEKQNYWALGSKIIVFDVNGEYRAAFKDIKDIDSTSRGSPVVFYKPTSNGLKLPHFLLNLDEWCAFLLATDATQRPFWDKVLQENYRYFNAYYNGNPKGTKKDVFINYFRHKINIIIKNVLERGETATSRLTSAMGVWSKLESIINQDKEIKDAQGKDGLLSDIKDLRKACFIYYGANKKEDEFNKKIDCLHKKVNITSVNQIKSLKLEQGQYFGYEFLKFTAEMVLLEEDSLGNSQMRSWVSTMLLRLDHFLDHSECKFMRGGKMHKDSTKYLKDVFSISERSKKKAKNQLIVIDVSELSPDILEMLTSVISRLIFHHRRESKKRTENPVHLILDEAHRYVKKNYDYKIKENIFERIAREGRKYSCYLLLSSQRPSELSETALSQCGNFIIHRVQNERDMKYVKDTMPHFSDAYADKVKQSTPGEAVIFGNCVAMPLHVRINLAKPEPESQNCEIPKEWFPQGKKKKKASPGN